MLTPYQNDPAALIAIAFNQLYPQHSPTIRYSIALLDDGLDGLTTYTDPLMVEISSHLPVKGDTDENPGADRILCHELAHVVVGYNHDHDGEWGRVMDRIWGRYKELDRNA